MPSVRNILRISWPRRLLWCLLVMSSIPLHLIYNSVIFASTSISEWNAFGVTSDFFTGAPFNVSVELAGSQAESFKPRVERLRDSTSLLRLENDACLAAYNNTIITSWGDVLVISMRPSSNNNSLLWAMGFPYGPETGDLGFCDSLGRKDYDKCLDDGSPDPNTWNSTDWQNPESSGKVL